MHREERFYASARALRHSARHAALAAIAVMGVAIAGAPVDAYAAQPPEKVVEVHRPDGFKSSFGVAPVLPDTKTSEQFEDSWPQAGRAWMQLDRDVDLRVKRMTHGELDTLVRKAEGGSALAQTMLGIVFREGTDRSALSSAGATGQAATFRSQMDNEQALKWLSKAASQGFPMAQVEIGEMYYRGHGVMRDIDQAIAWTELAARVDYPRAQLNLVQMKLFKATETADPEKTLEGIKGLAGEAMNAIRSAGSASGMR